MLEGGKFNHEGIAKDSKRDPGLSFLNFGRSKKLEWCDLVAVHFGDAGHKNRPELSSTGGYITGFADPGILMAVTQRCQSWIGALGSWIGQQKVAMVLKDKIILGIDVRQSVA